MRDVVRDGHVREQADLLDHVADPAAELDDVLVADARPVDPDVARVELDQPVDELHRGRLAGAGRADEDADLAGGDRQRELLDGGLVGARVPLRRAVEDDLGGGRRASCAEPRRRSPGPWPLRGSSALEQRSGDLGSAFGRPDASTETAAALSTSYSVRTSSTSGPSSAQYAPGLRLVGAADGSDVHVPVPADPLRSNCTCVWPPITVGSATPSRAAAKSASGVLRVSGGSSSAGSAWQQRTAPEALDLDRERQRPGGDRLDPLRAEPVAHPGVPLVPAPRARAGRRFPAGRRTGSPSAVSRSSVSAGKVPVDDVPEDDDPRPRTAQRGSREHRFERLQVAVDVGEGCGPAQRGA